MLCLDCHKVVDELERSFTVETMQAWKTTHAQRISSLFAIPNISDERQLLAEVNDLLEINGAIFREYGPTQITYFRALVEMDFGSGREDAWTQYFRTINGLLVSSRTTSETSLTHGMFTLRCCNTGFTRMHFRTTA